MAVLSVRNLSKIFTETSFFNKQKQEKQFIAVDNISFDIGEGEILGVLGPNGAGKTTTIQMLLSTLTPTSGSITYFGKDFFTHRSEILESVSFASTYVKLPGGLSVQENLDLYGRLYGLSSRERAAQIEKFLKFFDMWTMRDKQTGTLSAGQMTRIMLAKAFLSSPKIVLLDEPTASLDPDIAAAVREFVIKQQREWGTSVLFTSHNMDEVTEVCDRVIVLKRGVIIANDTPEKLAATVATARVHLVMFNTDDAHNVIECVAGRGLLAQRKDLAIEIEVDENNIAELLICFAEGGITYQHISIDKPTLEDYFLHIVKQG